MAELISLKMVQLFKAIKPKIVVAFQIGTIFNGTSSGIYKLTFKKLIIFLESRKDLPL